MQNSVSTSASLRGYGFLVFYLVLLSALGSFVNDMFTPALPAMRHFFDCSVPTVQMGLTAGMCGLGLGQIILGPVSDKYGRKPVLVASIAVFVIAAVISIFSPTIHFFIWCRFFQGLGVSGGYFLARTIPADLFGGRQLAKIMALVGAINGFAPASAPVLGGVVADTWGWRGIFVCLTAFAVIVLCLAPKMKESLPTQRRTQGSLWRSFGGFKVLLKNRPFMIHSCFKGVALGMLFAYISATPFILQEHYGYSQTGYGLIVGINSLFAAAGSMLALRFKTLKLAARVATLIVVIAVGAQAYALWHIHNFWLFEALMVGMLFGMGMIFTASNTLAMNEGRQHAGEASAILGLVGYVVGAIVSPLVGMGNILHSTAWVFIALAINLLVLNIFAYRLPQDLQ
ncbi:MAG: multidrug effflux MFS transporter [Bacteroides sp.]|nr:multidrug effflux MFS transporter [Bacteroides sp.]MCM1378817.1 multidrug effflux MFS transporter [Bacteroides sp.]MCM1445434.1 multidrug effflux MFS transporter [Prevotella sp.]